MISLTNDEQALRFNELLRVLREVTQDPTKQFTMHRWHERLIDRSKWHQRLFARVFNLPYEKGCAIGYACRDPWFNTRGLSLLCERHQVITSSILTNAPTPLYVTPERSYRGFPAIEAFFGLTEEETTTLFTSYWYPLNGQTIAGVSARLRTCMQEKGLPIHV